MRYIFIFLFLLLSANMKAPEDNSLIIPAGVVIAPYESIWRAVTLVESSGNRFAYNRAENAVGIVQIRSIRIKDFNTRSGKRYKLIDMYDTVKAKEVFLFYCKGRDFDKIVRDWNGSGYKTYEYLNKVKKHLTN